MSRGCPPDALTRYIPSGAPKRITPSAFHEPPVVVVSASGASLMAIGVLPLTSTRLSLPTAKKPMDVPSEDQNGKSAPSVPAILLAFSEFSGRSQSAGASFALATRNTMYRPSGETAVAVYV